MLLTLGAAHGSTLPFNLLLISLFLRIHFSLKLQDHVLQGLLALWSRLEHLGRAAGRAGWLLGLMAGAEAGLEFLIRAAAGRTGAGAAAFHMGGGHVVTS